MSWASGVARRVVGAFGGAFFAPLVVAFLCAPLHAGEIQLPPGFQIETLASGFTRPVAMSFAPDGRCFVAEQRGIVWVIDPNEGLLPQPFINLTDEVGNAVDRGLIGLALDPKFMENHRVFLSITVDPIFGRPDEIGQTETFARIVRYDGTVESQGNVANASTRTVLIGAIPPEGFPACASSHTIGTLHFGHDGSLFISAGDGAKFSGADVGGVTPGCFVEGMFPAEQDIGAFRAQSLDSLDGKVLRVDPETGGGLSDNPFYDGNPFSIRSRLWVTGLRNPFRFAVRPGTPSPGVLFVGDVGMGAKEEINIALGGENFGWPCKEGVADQSFYFDEKVPAWGCDTIETETNPGPLTWPVMYWSHNNPGGSSPPGQVCRVVVAGCFHPGGDYPAEYHGSLFHADYSTGWIRVSTFSPTHRLEKSVGFAEDADHPTDLQAHPFNGDICFSSLGGGIYRIRHVSPDFDGNGVIDGADFGMLLAAWNGDDSRFDLNGDGAIDGSDLGILLAAWTG